MGRRSRSAVEDGVGRKLERDENFRGPTSSCALIPVLMLFLRTSVSFPGTRQGRDGSGVGVWTGY